VKVHRLFVLVLLAAVLGAVGSGVAVAQVGPRILVMPLENATRDSKIFWLGEASAVLLADELNALGAAAITREERRAAFERLQVPPSAALTDATVIRIGQLVGASRVIVGTVQLEGDTLIVRTRSLALEAGRVQSSATERGQISEIFAICERLARSIVPPSARIAPDGPRVQPPLAAFENYIKGLMAVAPTTAVTYLNAALAIQPSFDRVRLALWDVYVAQDAQDKALAVVQPVAAASPWFRRARFRAGLSQLHLKRFDEAFAIFKALADSRPTPNVLNNLGVVQLRRGSGVTSETGPPTYYFNRAAESDKTDPDLFFNLGYAYWLERDTKAAIYWLREAVRRDPTDGDAHFVLGTALAAAGNIGEANREKELARRLSSAYVEWEKRPASEVVPRGLERLKTDVELPRASRVEEMLTTSGQRDQRELAQFYLDRGRRLYDQESDRDAIAELNRALFLSPYLPEAHLLLGRIHLRGGRFEEAIEALKISIWSAESADAHVVMADAYIGLKNLAAARAEAERALVLDPTSTMVRQVIERIDAANRKKP
jgi:tetratricopeptide (TPR) repeat protein